MPIVDPMAQPEAGGSQIREGFIVAQDVAALDADPPVPALAAVVLDELRDERTFTSDLGNANGDPRELPLGRAWIHSDLGVVALDEHHAIGRHMASARGEESEAAALIRSIDERAHEQHSPEGPVQVEILDGRQDGLGPLDFAEHALVEIDGSHPVTEMDERVRDAP